MASTRSETVTKKVKKLHHLKLEAIKGLSKTTQHGQK